MDSPPRRVFVGLRRQLAGFTRTCRTQTRHPPAQRHRPRCRATARWNLRIRLCSWTAHCAPSLVMQHYVCISIWEPLTGESPTIGVVESAAASMCQPVRFLPLQSEVICENLDFVSQVRRLVFGKAQGGANRLVPVPLGQFEIWMILRLMARTGLI